MFLNEYGGEIIKDSRYLQEDYVPEDIRFRGGELQEISNAISPFLHDKPMRNLFLYGPSGSGKTTSIKWVFNQVENETSKIACAYVNCWENPTNYSISLEIMKSIAKDIKGTGALSFKRNYTDILSEVLNFLDKRNKKLIVALDEIDRAESMDIIYNLSRRGVGIILISNNPYALKDIDMRIESSFSYSSVEYKPYSIEQLMSIIKDRIAHALYAGTFPHSFVRLVALNAKGDARIAISIVRNASLLAESKNRKKIDREDIIEAIKMSKSIKISQILSTLKLELYELYKIIEQNKEIKSKELYDKYIKKMEDKGIGISERTYRNYLRKLVSLGLIEGEGENRWKVYRIKNV